MGAWPSIEEQLRRDNVPPDSALERLIRQHQDVDMLRPEEAIDRIGLPLWLRVYWRKEHPELVEHFGFAGLMGNGGLAEFATVPAYMLHRLPDVVSFEQAALFEGRSRRAADEAALDSVIEGRGIERSYARSAAPDA